MNLAPDDREIALAREHPRGTEKRRLTPYRDALASPAAYAALPRAKRDEIARWAEARRRIRREHAVDADPGNLVDPLIPEARLRALVIAGEVLAAGVAADLSALVLDAEREGLPAVIAAVRSSRPTAAD